MEMPVKLVALGSLCLATGSLGLYACYQWLQRKQKSLTGEQVEFCDEDEQNENEGHMADSGENLLPYTVDLDRVHVVRSKEEWEEVFHVMSKELDELKVLGFDCEWLSRPGFSGKVALLQLATQSGYCALVRLNLLTDGVPESLRNILADKSILKTGVACWEDAAKLHKDLDLCVRGCVDLRYMLARRSRGLPLGNYGLKSLAAKVLCVDLDKSNHLKFSDWEAENLSEEQVHYAAADAVVGIDIFVALVMSRASSSSEDSSDRTLWQKSQAMCQGIVDVKFKNPGSKNQSAGVKQRPKTLPLEKPVSRAYVARTKPLYHNCQLRAPDGQLLCTCDIKKAKWYLEKGLAVKVGDDPLTIRLKFEPSRRPAREVDFYRQVKENICVVCGSQESFIKKHIIPKDYRKHFPPVMKEHKSHDVLLLCTSCHQQSSHYDSTLKQSLAEMCDAPIATEAGVKYLADHDLQKVRSAGKALLQCNKLPEERKQVLEQTLLDYYGVPTLDEKLLQEASEMDPKRRNSEFSPHGSKVVQYMIENQGLVEFERMWREHFLKTMEPKHLPTLWSVSHAHKRLADLGSGMKKAISNSMKS